MSEDKRLIVYKASAGSGKTYTLTKEYIGLLLRGWYDEHVSKHDRILAATFTNKATIELRERIIRELIRIRDGKEGNLGKQILQDWLTNGVIAQEEYLRRNKKLTEGADYLLRSILEDYGSFRVQTIDSFFQEVVRSFALEISSLAGTFNIELKQDDLITMSLDQLFIRLGEEGKEDIRRVLSEIYVLDADSGEEKKNIRQQLITLTSKFLENKDSGTPLTEGDYSEDKIRHARRVLRVFVEETKKEVTDYIAHSVKELNRIRVEYGIDYTDSSRGMLAQLYGKLTDSKKFISEYLEKATELISKTLREIVEDENKSFLPAKIKPGSGVYEGYASAGIELRSVLSELISYGDKLSEVRREYNTAVLILKYIDLMPALFEAKRAVEEYQREQNVVLISRINTLLKDIIDGADVPFIYDKVGTRIEHFMIDEFQDTSHLQWDNFLPLLEESLSHGRYNFLVGDVKQSIYRFRGADSSLLGEEVVLSPQANVKALGTNWRSHKHVVDFNNQFFENIYLGCIPYLEPNISTVQSHASVYENDIIQKAHHTDGGYVELNFFSKKGNTNDHLEDIKTEVLTLIVELQDEYRFHRRDIALLVYSNSDANMVANWLTEASAENPESAYKYNFISDEALSISSSRTVLLLAQYISYVANNRTPQKEIELRLYLQMYLLMASAAESVEEVFERIEELSMRGMGLFESISNVINALPDIPENEMVYVNAFMDHLFAFSSKNTGTFRLFEDWWNRTKDTLKVEMGGIARDSITIITIHKSKGLEFPVVIMPNADRDISRKKGRDIELFGSTAPLEERFKLGIPHYYLDSAPSDRNLNTFFDTQYLKGMEEEYVDNLNVLYVAFTRAAQHLYVYTGIPKEIKMPINRIGNLIYLRTKEIFGGETDKFVYGIREVATHDSESETNPHELKSLTANPRYNHLEFTTDGYVSGKMLEGTILHRILENARTAKDFELAVHQAVQSLLIDEEKAKEITARFEQAIQSNPEVAEWFAPSPDRIILSETSISECPDIRLHRPDRMILRPSTNTITVVDYKFGEHQSKYKSQVQAYTCLLRSIGYRTEGYLWYNLSADPADLIMIPNE